VVSDARGSQEVTEYAARNADGELLIRQSRRGEPYPAEQWARDQLALGARVMRRRVIVVEDWTEMAAGESP
jgi:hypothetical protein